MINYILALMFLLTGCTPKPPVKDNCGVMVTDYYGDKIIWRNLPITIVIGNIPEHLVPRVRLALSNIEASVGKPMFIVYEVQEASWFERNYVNTITMGQLEKPNQGITHLWWKGPMVSEADIVINENYQYYFDKKDVTRSLIQEINFDSLITHELLHLLGFQHSSDSNDLIYPYLSYDQDKGLSENEINNLKCVYGNVKNE